MRLFRCDNDGCEKLQNGEPAVSLNGVTGTSGGILLPEQFHKKDFCSVECFWVWVSKYRPQNSEAV